MSLAQFAGTLLPRSTNQLERDVEDALEGANARYGLEHDSDGRHTLPMDRLEVSSPLGSTNQPTFEVDGGNIVLNGLRRVVDGTDGVVSLTIATTQADLKMPDGSPIKANVVKLNLSADSTLTGVMVEDPSLYWDELEFINGSNFVLTVAHNTGSTSAYRFSNPFNVDFRVASGGMFRVRYDVGSRIWRATPGGQQVGLRTVIQGEITISGDGSTPSQTQSIASVDTTKAYVINRGWRNATRGMTVVLTNSTTVTAYRDTTDFGNAVAVGFTVVEYY